MNTPQLAAGIAFIGDGRLDLVAANNGGGSGNTVSVLLGNGAGSFGAASPFTVGTGPRNVVAADFNRDDKLDLVTADAGGGSGNTVSVLLGNGTGSFGAASPFTVGSWPLSVAAADFNRDGVLDLVTANHGANTVSVLLGATPAPTSSPTTNPTEQPTLAPSLSPTTPPFDTFNQTIGTDGPDNITTTGGHNLVEGKGDADILNGGPGDNALSYATSPKGVTVSLTTGRGRGGDAEGDTFRNFNSILGSDHDDILYQIPQSISPIKGANLSRSIISNSSNECTGGFF